MAPRPSPLCVGGYSRRACREGEAALQIVQEGSVRLESFQDALVLHVGGDVTPQLFDSSSLNTLVVQRRLVETLEERTGVDGRLDVRLRLVCDLAMSAWRAGAQNWVRRGRKAQADPVPAPRQTLVALIEEAFDALATQLGPAVWPR